LSRTPQDRVLTPHPEDGVFYVLDGTMTFLVGDRWFDAPKGSFVLAPRPAIRRAPRFQCGVPPVKIVSTLYPHKSAADGVRRRVASTDRLRRFRSV
jgi:mannose-6-phosphate isomerase-like protein (cupin superfamily)